MATANLNTTNLIAYLSALENLAVFIVTLSIKTILEEREIYGLVTPAEEQKTLKEWGQILDLLTPEEQQRVLDIVNLLRDPEASKQIYSTTNMSQLTYLLANPEVIRETNPKDKAKKIAELLTNPEIVKDIIKVSSPNDISTLTNPTRAIADLNKGIINRDTSNLINKINTTASLGKGISNLNSLYFGSLPKNKTLEQIQKEDSKRISAYNKQIEDHLRQKERETAVVEKKEAEEEKIRPKKKVKPTIDEGLKITRIDYPKWWNDSLNSTINITAPGSQVLATVSGKLTLFVSTIVLTVTGATVITIKFGKAGTSGPIHLGDSDQPKGMVIAMGNSPAPCGMGSLEITATDPNEENPVIGGFATCFAMEPKVPTK